MSRKEALRKSLFSLSKGLRKVRKTLFLPVIKILPAARQKDAEKAQPTTSMFPRTADFSSSRAATALWTRF
jgi:hypothetical protein